MFTGIIEATGEITAIEEAGQNKSFWIKSSISSELKPDQSVSHNGVCLTVEAVNGDTHKVTAVAQTLRVTNLGSSQVGQKFNLERCLPFNGRLDGHVVQGHADGTAICTHKTEKEGSTEFRFKVAQEFAALFIEKGSITINGISLTVWETTATSFKVTIIPYSMSHTNMGFVNEGDIVNIEFDVLGKYVVNYMKLTR